MDENNKNFILAIVLSAVIMFGWLFFVVNPQQEALRKKQQQQQELARKKAAEQKKLSGGGTTTTNNNQQTPRFESKTINAPRKIVSRTEALAASKRITIKTSKLTGSISLKGARIDDLVLVKYRETVEKNSKKVTLLSPAGSKSAYYVEHGWISSTPDMPNEDTVWKVEGNSTLTEKTPVTLVYDNGKGLIFKRVISIDSNYMFTVTQEVTNNTKNAVFLYPWAQVSRFEKPKTTDFFILHEGLVGVLGKKGTQKYSYDEALEDGNITFQQSKGWLGITDKYWATIVIPNQKTSYTANFQGQKDSLGTRFRTKYKSLEAIALQPNKSIQVVDRVFAGAKQTHILNNYEDSGIQQFGDLLDWGWFWFIEKPLFYALDFFNGIFFNYGLAILFVTVLIKLLMYPLANKSYESMSKMKKMQPEMQRIKERFKDDAMRQQKEMMALYKKEQINPMLGCLPIFVQIPVFFALYKVLFITIDMRHAPFFGWVNDLSAPDPTNIFNLFGLFPWELQFPFHIGIWAIIMGLTMWVQMKLNPQQADPMQQAIFNWLPLVFTFMLANFPAGLVIYWAWNNFLSIIQQRHIMIKNGVEVNLLENTGLDKLWGRFKAYTDKSKT